MMFTVAFAVVFAVCLQPYLQPDSNTYIPQLTTLLGRVYTLQQSKVFHIFYV
jgi:hypothetical protein